MQLKSFLILLTLFLLNLKYTCAICIDCNQDNKSCSFDFDRPYVILSDAKFHTNHTVPSPTVNQTKTSYKLAKTFKSLTFTCLANYPTRWKFDVPPFRDEKLKDFRVTKYRCVKNFADNSTYTFISNLTLNFKDPHSITKISCRGIDFRDPTGEKNAHRSTAIFPSTESYNSFFITINISNENDTDNISTSVSTAREGFNPDCNLTLSIDFKNQKFSCGTRNPLVNPTPKIIHCNNPDECNSIFVPDKTIPGSSCHNTVTNHCNDANCWQFLPNRSPGVIICYDENKNSIARRYLVTEVNKSLHYHLGNETDYDNETIYVYNPSESNNSGIYFGQNVTFTCEGNGAYYSHGFRWTIKNRDTNTSFDLEMGEETLDEELHIYKIHKTIHFTKKYGNLLEIICHGPNWNRRHWVNATKYVRIKEISRRYAECQEPNWTYKNVTTFRCLAEGSPLPQITWILGKGDKQINSSSPITNQSTTGFISISHSKHDNLSESKIVYHFQLTSAHNVTCIATNFIGEASTTYTCVDVEDPDSVQSWMYILPLSLIIFALGVSTLCGLFLIKKYRKKIHLTEAEISEFENGDPKADRESALLLPYNTMFEIPREMIFMDGQILGEGQYGTVVLGKYNSNKVAVKTVKKSIDIGYFKALLSEIKIMCYVNDHPHLVNLIGACTRDIRKKDVLVVTEYCANGNLSAFLKNSRGCFIDLFHFNSTEKQKQIRSIENNLKRASKSCGNTLSTINLVVWAYQIAHGMEYLSSKKVIHGDLAARNVLLTVDLHAKIGDFGLSKQLFDYSIYVQKLEIPLPLKWMAIESLQDLEFSVQSDVWAYGITLWELFSLGHPPYPGIPQWNFQSYKLLQGGYRMEPPQFCNKTIYKIMRECWNPTPKTRPNFTLLKELLLQELLTLKN